MRKYARQETRPASAMFSAFAALVSLSLTLANSTMFMWTECRRHSWAAPSPTPITLRSRRASIHAAPVIHGQALIGLPSKGKVRSPEVEVASPWPSRTTSDRRRYNLRKRYDRNRYPGAGVPRKDIVSDIPPRLDVCPP